MRASVLRNGNMVLSTEVPQPAPGPGQVLVAVRACGICGSDVHFAQHGHEVVSLGAEMAGLPPGQFDVDLSRDVFMGHEFCAEVLEAGPDTDAPAPGTLVTSIPALISADSVTPIFYTNHIVGGYADQMLLSAPLLVPVPHGVEARHAAFTEPVAVAVHAVNRSAIKPGETAIVLGCGPIGLAIIAVLRLRGIDPIVAANRSTFRRQLAERMGAHVTVDPREQSPFDNVLSQAVVFEAVGAPGMLDEVLRQAPFGTRVIVAGVCMERDTIRPFFGIAKQIDLSFVFAYEPHEFADALRAIADGSIDVESLITGEVGLDRVDEAFTTLTDPHDHAKILVIP
ncbi:zinc-binding dehydrogenase [Mycobacterium spongiae]|uniref:Zinc-binding dehydrogenase n=1 Tax=Mycobacterium spongiae TaxID=886343 RepID=A0A975JYN0_9MYCO|nr:zinc-binding dehydrogenase [Mycobacterium spongiae]QUR67818.1 zinc-binding dehydrogenase [Mycobacterium spongiae]